MRLIKENQICLLTTLICFNSVVERECLIRIYIFLILEKKPFSKPFVHIINRYWLKLAVHQFY